MTRAEPKIEGRSLEAYRTSAVNLLLSIHHDTEWQEAIEILGLAHRDIERAIRIADIGRNADEAD